ncbi:MAG: 3-hydroxyacyl-ACP dehydratase FabZ [Candidatus Omnitrophica bacterium]|nr:3-hydroxyacyl-ACP dehydratase FabZ [Candidatus Omnitrophota bacterium]
MLNVEEIKSLIPQRYPFLMIDRVIEIKEGEFIKAYKNISRNEECFNGHFPDSAVFPGAFIAEAMAQAACILLKKSILDLKATLFYVTNVKIRFFKTVIPGDQLHITIKTIKMTRIGGIFETEASVDNNIVSKGEMTFACK